MEHKLETKAGKAMYKLPGQIVVAEFGQIRDYRRFGYFLYIPLQEASFGTFFCCS